MFEKCILKVGNFPTTRLAEDTANSVCFVYSFGYYASTCVFIHSRIHTEEVKNKEINFQNSIIYNSSLLAMTSHYATKRNVHDHVLRLLLYFTAHDHNFLFFHVLGNLFKFTSRAKRRLQILKMQVFGKLVKFE